MWSIWCIKKDNTYLTILSNWMFFFSFSNPAANQFSFSQYWTCNRSPILFPPKRTKVWNDTDFNMKVDLMLVLGLSFFSMLMSPGSGAQVPRSFPSFRGSPPSPRGNPPSPRGSPPSPRGSPPSPRGIPRGTILAGPPVVVSIYIIHFWAFIKY